MHKKLRRFLAIFRLSQRAVCEESDARHDYHDYPDSNEHAEDGYGAIHEYLYTCRHCGARFYI